MDFKKVRRGIRVVVHSKTAQGRAPMQESSILLIARLKNQPFLWVIRKLDGTYPEVLLDFEKGNSNTGTGDYFRAEDFELYNPKIHNIMNIGSGQGYPASALSNFSPHPFELDGIKISSMEGFLQSLKFKSPEMAQHVCTLVGYSAKKKGKNKNWKSDQTLYWLGNPIKRDSKEYQVLLDKAYQSMYNQSDSFRRALKASGVSTLTHSMGRTDKKETVLTIQEFCSRLTKLRKSGFL